MPRYTERQKIALDALMKDDAYRHALKIIDADGLHGLTLARLARRIGVSRASLYNYFADRDAIVDFIEERTFEPVVAILERIADGEASPAAKLEAILTEIFGAVRENRTVVVALSPEKYSDRDRRSHLRRRQRGRDLLERVIREGIEKKAFRDLPPDLVSEVVYGTITGLVDNMAYSGAFRKPAEIVPTLMRVFLKGLER